MPTPGERTPKPQPKGTGEKVGGASEKVRLLLRMYPESRVLLMGRTSVPVFLGVYWGIM